MKNLSLFLFILACLSCSTEEVEFTSAVENSISCDNSALATVELMTASVSGVDDFYYIRIEDLQSGKEEFVYPKQLNESYKESGTEIKMNFAFTSEVYDYIICLPGHQIDANNPDVSDMRIIEICDVDFKS